MPIGSILGGIIGAGGARDAGNAAAAAGNNAYDKAGDWAKQLNGWLSTWSASGKSAQDEMDQLNGLGHIYQSGDQYGDSGVNQDQRAQDQKAALGRFQTTPDYQFRLTQGQNALDRSAASRGMVLSGQQDQASQKFGGDLASGEYNNYYSKLAGISGQGQNAMATVANAASPVMNSGINAQFQGNMSQAAGYQASANALASGIAHGINNLASISGLYGPMQGASYGGLSNFFGGMGGGGGGGDGAAAVGNYGYGSAAPSTGFGPFAGFGGNALAASGAGAGASGSAAGVGGGLAEMAPLAAL